MPKYLRINLKVHDWIHKLEWRFDLFELHFTGKEYLETGLSWDIGSPRTLRHNTVTESWNYNS